MSDFLTFMGAPAAGCLILTIVYTYFGCHVLKREIIFVDISLAQLAALGTTTAFVMEIDLESPTALALSILFVLAGGAFFSYTRTLADRVPQEAVIGIVYVVGASAALLLSSLSPHGAEHLKSILNGSILWITWPGILKLFVVSTLVAVPMVMFHKRIEEQSTAYRNPNTPGVPSWNWKWDVLFYFCLGLVIVFSVKTAGIYLIFSLLIIPAVCGALFTRSLVRQFVIGSVLGVGVCLIGLVFSFTFDLPTGATLVCTFGVIFLLAFVTSMVFRSTLNRA